MTELEERYQEVVTEKPLPQKRRMPIILEDGTVQFPDEEQPEPEQKFVFEEKPVDEDAVDFKDRNAVREKLAKYCTAIMSNPNDQGSISALFKLVQKLDGQAGVSKEVHSDVDMSLEVLLRNSREEGPLAQLRGLYNARMDRKFTQLIKSSFQGHKAAWEQLRNYLRQDVQFQNHAKIITLATEVLRKNHFQADSAIFFTLFDDVRVTKVSNLIPKERQKKALTKKSSKKGEKPTVQGMSAREAEEELRENQTTFVSNLILLSTTIIREKQRCGLLPEAFEMIIRFGGYLNAAIYGDILGVIKLYFYNWFKQQQTFDPLLAFLGEQKAQLFDMRVSQQYKVQNALNTARIYVKNHAELLELYDYSFLDDFNLALRVIKLLSNPIAEEDEVSKDSSILLVYLLAHAYKINTHQKTVAAIACFKQLLLGVPILQQANLIKRVGFFIKDNAFEMYAKGLRSAAGVPEGSDSEE